MTPKRKQRLYLTLILLAGFGVILALVLYALKRNINLYYTPSQVYSSTVPKHHAFRVGGLVEPHSVLRTPGTLKVEFIITDLKQEVPVYYEGVLPALFRAGQGIVVQGQFNKEGLFVAEQVLAKHDARYKPPGIST